MSQQFISLFINMLNAKMITEAMGLLHTQPLSPFLPIPLQMKRPSPLNVLPQGFSSNHCSSCYLSCNACGIPGILHTMQDSQMALKDKSHARENEFASGVEVQRVSTQGTLHTVWLQSLLLCVALGVITLKPTPTISPRTPPRPGLGFLTTFLPCLALQGTGFPFSELGHNFQHRVSLPLPTAACSCLTCHLMHRDALKWPRSFLQDRHLKSLQTTTSQLLQPTSTPVSSALFPHPSQSLQRSS